MLSVRKDMQSHAQRNFKASINLPNKEVPGSTRSTLQLLCSFDRTSLLASPTDRIQKLVAENAVVVFSMSSCCMGHVVKRLFFSLGVNPAVYDLDMEPGGTEIEKAFLSLEGAHALPAIYVGGKLIGSLDRLVTAHISGTLVPQLKEAGALWL